MRGTVIDEKSFMEFFEKEYGVKFVDAETGRKALDVVEEHKGNFTKRIAITKNSHHWCEKPAGSKT